jgi:hypothetical protein
MASPMALSTIDLSRVSDTYYRERLRFGRWFVTGAFFAVAGFVAANVIKSGPELSAWEFYVVFGILEGFFGVLAFYYAVPGPIETQVTQGTISFRYQNGRVRVVSPGHQRIRCRLVERLAAPTARRFRIEEVPELYAILGINKIPLTRPAWDAISTELGRSGIVPKESRKSDSHYGSWRILDYRTG